MFDTSPRRTRDRTVFVFLMIRRPPRSTLDRSSAASDVYKRQDTHGVTVRVDVLHIDGHEFAETHAGAVEELQDGDLSLIHISEPTRPY